MRANEMPHFSMSAAFVHSAENHFVATQQEVSIPQLWTTLSVLALPDPTEAILVEHAGHMCAATILKDPERIPLAEVSATLV